MTLLLALCFTHVDELKYQERNFLKLFALKICLPFYVKQNLQRKRTFTKKQSFSFDKACVPDPNGGYITQGVRNTGYFDTSSENLPSEEKNVVHCLKTCAGNCEATNLQKFDLIISLKRQFNFQDFITILAAVFLSGSKNSVKLGPS